MRFLRTFEELSWSETFSDVEVGKLASHDDGTYQMDLEDVDYINDNVMIISVTFFNLKDKRDKGEGKFRYVKSSVVGLTGDITPIKMNGALAGVYNDESEIIFDFLQQLFPQVNL